MTEIHSANTKHIGIVGCSAEGAALCYRTICMESAEYMGEHNHPEITMHTYPLAMYTPFFPKNDWKSVGELMVASAEKVAALGAEFTFSPDNTIHQAMEHVYGNIPIPWLHIAEVVADEAIINGYKHIGIMGTKFLMTGPVYPDAFRDKYLEYSIPTEEERGNINSIIFNELVYGTFLAESRNYFNRVIQRLKDDHSCDAVVLGCTEIPLLVIPEESPLPVLDSTRLLARAALLESLGKGQTPLRQ